MDPVFISSPRTALDPMGPLLSLSKNLSPRVSSVVESQAAGPSASSGESKRTLPSRAPHVLYAEDDDNLRHLTTAVLTSVGFTVTSCPDAETAETLVRSCVVPDVLLTDIEMPGESGVWLADRLTLWKPDLPVIIVSGAILREESLMYFQQREWLFMPKPVAAHRLVEAIRSITDHKTPQRCCVKTAHIPPAFEEKLMK